MKKRAETRPRASSRSAARLAAVQALYQWEQSGTASVAIIREFTEHRIGKNVDGIDLPSADLKLFGDLVNGTTENAAASGILPAVPCC